jgi:adenylate cyclase
MVLGAVFFSVNQANISNARLHIEEALQITANTFAKTLEDREYILTDKIRLLSGDFAFKSAFSTRDPETILSALENHRQRVGASIMMLLSMDGVTIADTANTQKANAPQAFSELLDLAMTSEYGEASAIQVIDGLAYQMVIVPLFTPEPSAWILIGFVIDDDLALTLREFTHSEVSLLYRIRQEPWQIISSTLPAGLKSQLRDGYVDGGKEHNQIFDLEFEGEHYLSRALGVQNGSIGDGVAILQRSLDAALVPYMRLRVLMLVLFGIGLILSIVGVFVIARDLSSPIEKLVKATRRVEEGDYSEGVHIPRKDEIGKLAHSVNSMVKGLAERDKVQSLLGKVISREVADELLSKKIELGGEEREVTILFSDIRSFTSLCELHSPQEILALLNRYLTRMSTSVEKFNGVVDKYIGDAIMALFGAPVSLADGPQQALACAIEMRAGLKELNKKLLQEGKQPLAIGIGINTDRVVAGNMGSINRLNYTVIGDGVNLASRLEGLTKRYGVDIILSQSTRDRCTGFSFRELDLVRVKGKDEPVAIFEPLPLEKNLPDKQVSHLAVYNDAIGHYRSCQWDKAEELLERLIREDAKREIYQLYLRRIAEFRRNPPPPDWDHVTIFNEK